jgi:hypothetical protein
LWAVLAHLIAVVAAGWIAVAVVRAPAPYDADPHVRDRRSQRM